MCGVPAVFTILIALRAITACSVLRITSRKCYELLLVIANLGLRTESPAGPVMAYCLRFAALLERVDRNGAPRQRLPGCIEMEEILGQQHVDVVKIRLVRSAPKPPCSWSKYSPRLSVSRSASAAGASCSGGVNDITVWHQWHVA